MRIRKIRSEIGGNFRYWLGCFLGTALSAADTFRVGRAPKGALRGEEHRLAHGWVPSDGRAPGRHDFAGRVCRWSRRGRDNGFPRVCAQFRRENHSFAEALNQLEDAADYAHFRWVSFPADQWRQVSASDQKANIEKVKRRGFGLLLVENDHCHQELKAIREERPDPVRIEALLRAAEVSVGSDVPVWESLRPDESVRASMAVAACLVAMSILPEAAKSAAVRLSKPDWMTLALGEEDFAKWARFFCGVAEGDGGQVDFDPFGLNMGDGQPTLWI